MGSDCPHLDGSSFSLTSQNVSGGSTVNVSCQAFGHRVVGSRTLQCNASTGVWNPGLPFCRWTWEFTTQEKVVLGTALGCAAFLVVVAIITLISCCCCRRRRQRQEEKHYNDMIDNPAFTPSAGDRGGLYPDAYFAYQDMGHKQDPNGATGSLDRAWLGYIPRPKVADGKYYH